MIPESFLPAGIAPFAGISLWAVAYVFAAHFFGCFIRGAFGFGSNMPIVLLTTWVLGPHHAILLAVLTTLVAQFQLLRQGIAAADWPVARPLVLGLFAGILAGTWLFASLAGDWLTLVLGLLIGAIIVTDRLRLLERLAAVGDLRAPAVTSALALTSGTVGTVAGGGGLYFLVIYLRLACRSPAALRGTNIMLTTVFVVGRLAALTVAGLFTPSLLAEAGLLIPAVLLGTWAGTRSFRAASPERFYAALQLLLLAAAAALVVRGALRLV